MSDAETMNEKLARWFKGNQMAVQFTLTLWDACQKWDDVYDGDPITREEKDDVMAWLAFGKEFSPFFEAHANVLRPALLTMYLQWQAANEIENNNPSRDDFAKTFMLRAGFYGVIHTITWMIGGTSWSRECGAEIYRAYSETAADIEQEIL